MWEGPDTLGLISCIAGTILLFVPVSTTLLFIVVLFGGSAVLVMGIIAVVKSSKIGIAGIVLGAILIVFCLFTRLA